jgi:serine/threonine protein kinase
MKACELRRRSSPTLSTDIPVRPGLEIRPAEFYDLEELGCGFGGIVYKSIHLPSGKVMARKVIHSRISSAKIRKSLAAELATLQRCKSLQIVSCFGAFVSDLQVSIALEYMDIGSLDWVCRTVGPIPEPYLAQVTKAVLDGLLYLHQQCNIIHRDLKPSNILLNSKGEIKICDFGESIELVNSMAKSLVGTTGYMAPERIKGQPYTIRSDVWSLGISLVELATGNFPYYICPEKRVKMTPIDASEPTSNGEETKMSLIELWESISQEPSPGLDSAVFSPEFVDFTRRCLCKDETYRPDPYQLLVFCLVVLSV